MSIDEIEHMRQEEQRATNQALTVILKQFQVTGDINQAIEDISYIMEQG